MVNRRSYLVSSHASTTRWYETPRAAAIKRILAEYGFELSAGQGFHMTRKTFATRMLRADNKLDDISNALGHARQETAEVYLERDEDKMRLCPLEFGGVLS